MSNIPSQEQVRMIFKDTYSIYKLYHNYELFKTIMNLIPFVEQQQAREIMSETYEFYEKYKYVSYDEDWCQLCKEAKEINKKYDNNDFCRGILEELLDLLEQQFTSSKKR